MKAVDERLPVGGPSTAAAGWVDDLLEHAAETGVPVDFVTTHTYGAPPLDLRPILERYGRTGIPLWWTEWGVSPTHGAPVNDSVWGAPLVARGMRSAAGRVDALSYWVASDQFVELGVPEQLFHGGFGLLTIGKLRKPRFWAIAVLEQLGDEELASRVDRGRRRQPRRGVGEPGRGTGDRVAVALWNGSLDQTKTAGDEALGRHVTLDVTGLPAGEYRVEHRRVDDDAFEHRPHLGGDGRRRLADGGPMGAAPRGRPSRVAPARRTGQGRVGRGRASRVRPADAGHLVRGDPPGELSFSRAARAIRSTHRPDR